MGTYDFDGSFVWNYLSDWNGSWGMSLFFRLESVMGC